jgi:hypothetical protein
MTDFINLLKNSLGECKRPHNSPCIVSSSYEPIKGKELYIIDEIGTGPVRICSNNDDYQLKVTNKHETEIWLIKTDKCLFDASHKKCDCILLNEKQVYFIEIKDAQSNRGVYRRKAYEQIETTIRKIEGTGIDLSMFEKTAVICFKNNAISVSSSVNNTKKAYFWSNFKTTLTETQEVLFR